MANLNLPPNVKLDPNTGLYRITNAQGKTVRVSADTQDQLDQYVKSVDTGVPATITVTDPNTGNPRTQTFDSGKIIAQTDSINQQNALLTAGKRQAGVLGNADGSYQDLRTGKTISQEEAAAKIQAAGLPPETLQAVTPKNAPSYQAAQTSANSTTNTPSNIPAADATAPSQAQSGTGSGAAVDASVAAPPAATPPQVTSEPGAVGDEALQATEDAQAAALAEQEGRAFAPAPVSGDEAIDAANEAELAQLREAEGAAIFAPNPVLGSGDEAIDAANEAELAQIREAEGAAIFAPDPLPAATPSPDFAANPDEEAERDNLNAAIKQGTLDKARAQNTIANQRRNPNNGDWRVKLRLAPGSTYLYNAPGGSGILQPLAAQGGVIFPYTPTIATTYKATYSSYDLTHSNYKGYYYQGSQVEPVTLSCPFTAQSTVEAEYLLAVIHFFKSVTKMFYGQDPERGTPPPLVYLTGLGEFQFNEHPCVVQSFTYELPADVDYIRARSPNVNNSNMLNKRQSSNATGPGTTWGGGILGNVLGGAINRLANAGLPKGGMSKQPAPASFGQNSPTYVPTKMTIAISLLPVQSRKQQSQQFSLRQYANGDLLKGGFW